MIELVKIIYTAFMESDVHLLNPDAGNRFKALNLSMHEEIGQIQYLFCDKTGTLTKNELRFQKMAVRGMKSITRMSRTEQAAGHKGLN